ncbi:hypothetical protein WT83_14200 [Burkholderia territorii]|uniref:Uncharacterized protein n=1 Tax=Burkholderia territorii TaxID=1503055 RepID=A0A125K7F9_9BURK|nr:hypothetical protein WT83_14200 [Burkholderia territorii]
MVLGNACSHQFPSLFATLLGFKIKLRDFILHIISNSLHMHKNFFRIFEADIFNSMPLASFYNTFNY